MNSCHGPAFLTGRLLVDLPTGLVVVCRSFLPRFKDQLVDLSDQPWLALKLLLLLTQTLLT